VKNHR